MKKKLLRTLPLRKHAPSRAPVSEHQPSPRTLLTNLDHRLPCRAISITSATDVLVLPREPDDLAGWCLDGQLGRLRATAARGARRRLGGVCVVGAARRNTHHAHSRSGADEWIWRSATVHGRTWLGRLIDRGGMLTDAEDEGIVECYIGTLRLRHI
jgi:hypothetical protein